MFRTSSFDTSRNRAADAWRRTSSRGPVEWGILFSGAGYFADAESSRGCLLPRSSMQPGSACICASPDQAMRCGLRHGRSITGPVNSTTFVGRCSRAIDFSIYKAALAIGLARSSRASIDASIAALSRTSLESCISPVVIDCFAVKVVFTAVLIALLAHGDAHGRMQGVAALCECSTPMPER